MVAVSGDIAGWAASVQWTAPSSSTAAVHDHGASGPVAQQPTAAQLEAAAKLVAETKAAVARFGRLQVAIAAGYKPMEPPDGEIVHYVNTTFMADAYVLDPQHVQSLIYYNGKQGPVLIGAMFIMPNRAEDGPDIGGPLTVWHQHNNICFDNSTGIAVAFVHSSDFDSTDKAGSCPRGSTLRVTPQMLHVWLIDNPEGPFASTMDPQVLGTSAAVS
jgi:hypothetical protein